MALFFDPKQLTRRYGNCALITGASSGIGKSLAVSLAAAGFDLLLCARDEGRLSELQHELQEQYGVRVHIFPVDLSQQAAVAQFIEDTSAFSIGLAVFSAGFGTSGLFVEGTAEEEHEMLLVNCAAVLQLSHAFGKKMARQGKGGMIFLSSIVAFQGVPYAAHYAATKGYIQLLAEGVARELKPFGVDVLSVAPGPVNSGFGQRANLVMGAAMQPESLSIPVLRALGRRTTVYPGFLSKLLAYSLSTVPRRMKTRIMGTVMKKMAVKS